MVRFLEPSLGEQGRRTAAAGALEGLCQTKLSRLEQGSRLPELLTQRLRRSEPTSPPVKPSACSVRATANSQTDPLDNCHWRAPAKADQPWRQPPEECGRASSGAQGLISSQRQALPASLQGLRPRQLPGVLVGAGSRVLLSNHAKPGQNLSRRRHCPPMGAAPLNQAHQGHPAGMEKRAVGPPVDATAAAAAVIQKQAWVAAMNPGNRPSGPIRLESHCPGSSGNGASQGPWRSAQGGPDRPWLLALEPGRRPSRPAARPAGRQAACRLQGGRGFTSQHRPAIRRLLGADGPRLDCTAPVFAIFCSF